jgi:hypothetical protein
VLFIPEERPSALDISSRHCTIEPTPGSSQAETLPVDHLAMSRDAAIHSRSSDVHYARLCFEHQVSKLLWFVTGAGVQWDMHGVCSMW